MSATAPVKVVTSDRPTDFYVELTTRSAPLPPPHGSCFRVRIGAAPGGAVVLEVNGGTPHGPEWMQQFPLYATHLDWLFGALAHHGCFTTEWCERVDIPVGGGSQTLLVTAHGRQTCVPAYVIDEQMTAARSCREAVEALVPSALREGLEQRRERYVRTHR